MTGEFRTTRTPSIEVTFQRGTCGATVRNGKFRNAYLMDRDAGYVICRSIGDLENLIRDIQAVLADVRAELSE